MNSKGVEETKASPPKYKLRGDHVAIFILGVAFVVSLGYAVFQHRSVGELVTARDQLAASLGQTKAEVETLSAQVKAMATSQRSAEQRPNKTQTVASASAPATMRQQPKAVRRSVAQRARVSRPLADDPRWKKIDSDLAKARSDLEGSIRSSHDELEGSIKTSHDELNGSIAKTHEELMALQQKGERNYYEFDLGKSRQFQRTGPISVSLRKANTKHGYCDLEVRVDDNELSKKHVNLFEPVFFSPGGYSQPIELVINRIDKNHIKGYVSRPKYEQAKAAPADLDRSESVPSSGAALAKKPEPVLLTPR